MQENQKNSDESRTPPCLSRIGMYRCRCGAWHLRYRYVDVTIGKETLYLIMEECFRHDELNTGNEGDAPGPMIFTLGVVTLTILPMDYAAFSKAIGDAVSEDLGIGKLFVAAESGGNDRSTGNEN